MTTTAAVPAVPPAMTTRLRPFTVGPASNCSIPSMMLRGVQAGSNLVGWLRALAEQRRPFGPVPLQDLRPYYGQLRPCAPHPQGSEYRLLLRRRAADAARTYVRRRARTSPPGSRLGVGRRESPRLPYCSPSDWHAPGWHHGNQHHRCSRPTDPCPLTRFR